MPSNPTNTPAQTTKKCLMFKHICNQIENLLAIHLLCFGVKLIYVCMIYLFTIYPKGHYETASCTIIKQQPLMQT